MINCEWKGGARGRHGVGRCSWRHFLIEENTYIHGKGTGSHTWMNKQMPNQILMNSKPYIIGITMTDFGNKWQACGIEW